MNALWAGAFAEALLDPERRPPAGLVAWNGSDVKRRFAVYRNNVVVSLVDALGAVFPVVQALVGETFFRAMARAYVRSQPPTSPVLVHYGEGFADWLAGFEPARGLRYLPDMARLEFARVAACHAADAVPMSPQAIAAKMTDVAALPGACLALHPSCRVLRSGFAVRDLWAAHQSDGDWSGLDVDAPNATLVLRNAADDVLVIGIGAAAASFIGALRDGASLGEAWSGAPDLDLPGTLALLIHHEAIVAWHEKEPHP